MPGFERKQVVGTELSDRERQVLEAVVRTYVDTAEPAGSRTVSRGFDLGISVQTTKIHRHRVFAKLEADSIAHLVRIADALGIAPLGSVR